MRFVKRKNDVYKVELPDCNRFFQYLQSDASWLGGHVIAIFEKKYDKSELPDVNEIVKGQVEYFCHTDVNIGVELGFWNKYGNAPACSDLSDIYFRNYIEYDCCGVKPHWHIWRVNENLQSFKEVPEQLKNSYITYLFSPYSIYHKISHGKFLGEERIVNFKK